MWADEEDDTPGLVLPNDISGSVRTAWERKLKRTRPAQVAGEEMSLIRRFRKREDRFESFPPMAS